MMSSPWRRAALSACDGRNRGTLSQKLSELENERDQD